MLEEIRSDLKNNVIPLVDGIVEDSKSLVMQEIALLKSEIKQATLRIASAGVSTVIGVTLCLTGVFAFGLSMAHLINWLLPTMPLWACYGIVALLAIGGGCLALMQVKSILDGAVRDWPYTTSKQ